VPRHWSHKVDFELVAVVERMLELAEAGPSEVVYDLGCGDGRIPIMAAKRYGGRGFGCDIDPDGVAESSAQRAPNARRKGVEHLTGAWGTGAAQDDDGAGLGGCHRDAPVADRQARRPGTEHMKDSCVLILQAYPAICASGGGVRRVPVVRGVSGSGDVPPDPEGGTQGPPRGMTMVNGTLRHAC
jgi:SAM-dependent methyltransferase